MVAAASGQSIIYVDQAASGVGDGSSWADAFASLHDALDLGVSGDVVRVAVGEYVPSRETIPGDPRSATFALAAGVSVEGGYAGVAGADPNELVGLTHVSGDIGVAGQTTDNVYHVLTAAFVGEARIDRFAVRDGWAAFSSSFPFGYGAGLLADGSDLHLTNCSFYDNLSAEDGAAIYQLGSRLHLDDCSFSSNQAGDGSGGAVCSSSTHVTIESCSFSGNIAGSEGGGLWLSGAAPDVTLRNCNFNGNEARAWHGGGASISGGTTVVSDCAFSDNESLTGFGAGLAQLDGALSLDKCIVEGNSTQFGWAGGIYCPEVQLTLTECEIRDNDAPYGGGVYAGGSTVLVDRCTFSDNGGAVFAGGLHAAGGFVTVLRSVFRGNFSGTDQFQFAGSGGAISGDGLFVSSVFLDNGATGGVRDAAVGGAIAGSGLFLNCLFGGNSVNTGGTLYPSNGGAIGGSGLAVNCTVVANRADSSGVGNGFGGGLSGLAAVNCILWGNEDSTGAGEFAQITGAASYSCVQGLATLPGPGNIGGYPGFVSLGPDGLLGTIDDDLRLAFGSPCIDAGDNGGVSLDDLDIDCDGDLGETFPWDLDGMVRLADVAAVVDSGVGSPPVVDMGCYEFGSTPARWESLGYALAGSTGEPLLAAEGTLEAGDPIDLTLAGALPGGGAFFVVGATQVGAPFKGGTLVPDPNPPGLILPLFVGPAGDLSIGATWPIDVPCGTTLYFQYWIQDPGGPVGFSASNAISGTTP